MRDLMKVQPREIRARKYHRLFNNSYQQKRVRFLSSQLKYGRMRVIWSLILFIICIDAVAQDRKVIGRVLDSLTNKPIKDVHVVIHGTTLETFTNQLGFFEIPVVNESAAIVASHTSYKSVKVQIPSASRFSFSMNKSTIDLGRVNLNEYTNIQLIDFANTSQEQGSDNNQRGSSMESDASFRGGY